MFLSMVPIINRIQERFICLQPLLSGNYGHDYITLIEGIMVMGSSGNFPNPHEIHQIKIS